MSVSIFYPFVSIFQKNLQYSNVVLQFSSKKSNSARNVALLKVNINSLRWKGQKMTTFRNKSTTTQKWIKLFLGH
jgi:hypothetical protein